MDYSRFPADPARHNGHGNELEEVEEGPHHSYDLGDDDEDHDDQYRSHAQPEAASSLKP